MNLKNILLSFTGATALQGSSVSYEMDLIGAIFDPSASDHVTNGILDLASGNSVSFDTDTGSLSGSATGMGGIFNDSFGREYAVFNFDSVNIPSGVSISVSGSRGFALLSRGTLTLSSSLSFNGSDGITGSTGFTGSTGTAGSNAVSNGGIGGDGGNGGRGGTGGVGGTGGTGGRIALVSEDLLTLSSDLSAAGGLSALGGRGGVGGFGGNGGNGGNAAIGSGGDGGNGGRGGDAGFGGDGGFGGNGGDGGFITLGAPTISLSGALIANGQIGSSGGSRGGNLPAGRGGLGGFGDGLGSNGSNGRNGTDGTGGGRSGPSGFQGDGGLIEIFVDGATPTGNVDGRISGTTSAFGTPSYLLPVPEPSSGILALLGVSLTLLRRRH